LHIAPLGAGVVARGFRGGSCGALGIGRFSLPARNANSPNPDAQHLPGPTGQRAQGVALGLALVLGIKAGVTLITVHTRSRQCGEKCGCGCLAVPMALLVAVLLGIAAPLAAYAQHCGYRLYQALIPEWILHQWAPDTQPFSSAAPRFGSIGSIQPLRRAGLGQITIV